MFLSNKYSKWYHAIMNHAKTRNLSGYKERHHIVPFSLGGSDQPENLVDLTAREHFIAHALLVQMTEGKARASMAHAFWRMVNSRDVKYTSGTYERAKREHANALRKPKSAETRARMRKPHCEEAGPNISRARLGMQFSESHKSNIAKVRLNTKAVHRDGKFKFAPANEVQSFLDQGWKLGKK